MILLAAICLASEPLRGWSLEQDDGGFQPGGDLLQWRWGTVASGPGAGFDGRRAWAVGLTGSYLNDAVETLTLPELDLRSTARPALSFQHWHSFGDGDVGWVEVNDGTGWSRADPIYGYPTALGWSGSSAGWELVTIELSTLATVQVRFVFEADLTGVGAGWFLDTLAVWDGDVTPPRVSALDVLPDSERIEEAFEVQAIVEDDTGVNGVTLLWQTDHGGEGTVLMTPGEGGSWVGLLPGQPPDTRVSYHALATDGANETRQPTAGEVSFRVYLPAPEALQGPSGRVAAVSADLTWSPPVSTHEVLGYEVWSAEALVASTTDSFATVPLTGGDDRFWVRGVYAEGEGDFSEPFDVQAIVPALVSLSPAQGWAGEELRLEIVGDHALFVQDEVGVAFGEGVEVESVTVRDVDRLRVHVRLDPAATAGVRDVEVDVAGGRLTLPAAFSVEPDASRPRLVSIDPDRVEQGDSGTLRIGFVGSLAVVPEVSLGEGVVAEVIEVDGDELVVTYSVAGTAPVGEHDVQVDDGSRIFDGVSLEVRDWRAPVLNTCGSGGGVPGAVGVVAAVALLRRRRLGDAG